MHKKETTYQPIENYGIIGNLHTVALVSLNGSIDFMSFPRFDAPTIFCRLLDAAKGGSFCITPLMENMVTKQLYLPDTNVLVSRFFSDEGIAEVIDYMPVTRNEASCAVIRKITTIRGKVSYRMRCAPRFNYAGTPHRISQDENSFLFSPEDKQLAPCWLTSHVPAAIEGDDVVASFTLQETESACFMLESVHNRNSRSSDLEHYEKSTYRQTVRYWQRWLSRSTYEGQWKEMVHRSALTLKLLTSNKYGSMVAAPTFSLPEAIGHGRNWDYRYTWIRDAAFAMHAFLQLGFLDEAKAFLQWVKAQSTEKDLQLMFAIDGSSRLDEYELPRLEGYMASQPVRIGNDAYRQTQMDVYGELLETIYIYAMHGGDITYDYWRIIAQYVELVIQNWRLPDHSIWEVRGIKREFLFSRLMCWVALDRAIKIANHFSFPFDILRWHGTRDEIFRDVYDNFWNEEKQSFVQFKGSDNLDASALLMPILRIISPESDKWRKTMQAIDRELRSDVLIYRYREQTMDIDGMKGKEGTFTMCSFWHVECLALNGEIDRAKEHFEKMIGYANHLGLFSEQLGMKGEHLGNFPQAFTHLGLISAAIELSKQEQAAVTEMPSYYSWEMK
ncbi:glycoside hydrolase family 15 protein [Chitinophaga japonensis]|uniref:GH15 family glucan-1,4-alpha-glucosidase n=1 Tax=Chitinophaga japonensis TaxID=104662 RepID=A0A562SUU3_CHIJA|nr:glycoside hydrolase family 15 protein [Chitinophaga japonensis]TWI84466.1 GH15 family glucan-1,4-alpha-glucosidase [Chitinophaga japonensis]